MTDPLSGASPPDFLQFVLSHLYGPYRYYLIWSPYWMANPDLSRLTIVTSFQNQFRSVVAPGRLTGFLLKAQAPPHLPLGWVLMLRALQHVHGFNHSLRSILQLSFLALHLLTFFSGSSHFFPRFSWHIFRCFPHTTFPNQNNRTYGCGLFHQLRPRVDLHRKQI